MPTTKPDRRNQLSGLPSDAAAEQVVVEGASARSVECTKAPRASVVPLTAFTTRIPSPAVSDPGSVVL